jgi:hypothetical protein
MSDPSKWMAGKQRTMRGLLGAGMLCLLAGAALESWGRTLPFDPRILTGLGIFLFGVGAAQFLTYRLLRADNSAVSRTMVAERDERVVMIRAQAGNRAFWVSLVLGYVGLMWASFAGNGQLPALEGDVLWFYLVVLVMIPFVVYLVSYVMGTNRG